MLHFFVTINHSTNGFNKQIQILFGEKNFRCFIVDYFFFKCKIAWTDYNHIFN